MENTLLILFLILFLGRIIWRYILQQLNIRHLRNHGKEIPPVFQGMIDEATLAKMVDYTYDNSRLETKENLVEDILELAILFLLLPVLVGKLFGLQWHLIWQALIFFGVLSVIGGVAGIPFDIYHTFVLEKKYGFSTITWKLWLTDLVKSVIISAVLMGVLLSAFMAFILYLPKSWWFWAWVFFTAFEILLMWLYPVVIAPLFNKYEPIKDEELKEKITSLLAKVGLKAKGIFQVDEGKRSKHTNAYFTGIGKTKRIVLYDTLLASHSHEEILAVLAHEIGHWKKKHILKQLIFMIVLSLVGLYFVYLVVNWPSLYGAFGLKNKPVYAGLLLVSIYLSCIGFFFSPLGAIISRRYEREADKMAHELTGTSEPMINALKRLAKDNLSNLHPHPLYVWFYYSHPPLIERIEYLKSIDKEIGNT
ncbi:MAG: peptidase M48 [Deltaproteobacteria bacterium HGW-Deltaproteobacteria-2]|jgi:STE24 endopeptidase|nr:MAG: peptidase M48 [Deltaproteobacteria bacterium HGW-Deltaproteobacteria-2]